jgi:hypothetical protein
MNRKDRDAKGIAPIQPELKILMLYKLFRFGSLFWKIKQNRCFNAFLLSLPKILKTQNILTWQGS